LASAELLPAFDSSHFCVLKNKDFCVLKVTGKPYGICAEGSALPSLRSGVLSVSTQIQLVAHA
jgi:hypothetical protein